MLDSCSTGYAAYFGEVLPVRCSPSHAPACVGFPPRHRQLPCQLASPQIGFCSPCITRVTKARTFRHAFPTTEKSILTTQAFAMILIATVLPVLQGAGGAMGISGSWTFQPKAGRLPSSSRHVNAHDGEKREFERKRLAAFAHLKLWPRCVVAEPPTPGPV